MSQAVSSSSPVQFAAPQPAILTLEQWKEDPETVRRQVFSPDGPCHFRTARLLSRLFANESEQPVKEMLADIASISPVRAALLFIDTCRYLNDVYNIHCRRQEFIADVQRESPRIAAILTDLPTIDGAYFRWYHLHASIPEAFAPTLAAWRAVHANSAESNPMHCSVSPALGQVSEQALQAAKRYQGRFMPLNTPLDDSDPPATALCAYNRWSKFQFPVDTYGYSHVEHLIHHSRDGYCSVPSTGSWDQENPLSHQCFHSASSTRSFFSQHGIAADAYFRKSALDAHNLAIAFPEKGGRFYPQLVDGCLPYAGTYRLDSDQNIIVLPTSFDELEKIDRYSFNLFGRGFWGSSCGAASGIPWFAQSLPSIGRTLVAYAEVLATVHDCAAAMTCGMAEYYGHGLHYCVPRFKVQLLSTSGEPAITSTLIFDPNDNLRLKFEPGQELPEAWQSAVLGSAETPAAAFLAMLRRFGIPTGDGYL